jgi:hypothetical protein
LSRCCCGFSKPYVCLCVCVCVSCDEICYASLQVSTLLAEHGDSKGDGVGTTAPFVSRWTYLYLQYGVIPVQLYPKGYVHRQGGGVKSCAQVDCFLKRLQHGNAIGLTGLSIAAGVTSTATFNSSTLLRTPRLPTGTGRSLETSAGLYPPPFINYTRA